MPSLRHWSPTLTWRLSTCFSAYTICSTENLLFRIASLPLSFAAKRTPQPSTGPVFGVRSDEAGSVVNLSTESGQAQTRFSHCYGGILPCEGGNAVHRSHIGRRQPRGLESGRELRYERGDGGRCTRSLRESGRRAAGGQVRERALSLPARAAPGAGRSRRLRGDPPVSGRDRAGAR